MKPFLLGLAIACTALSAKADVYGLLANRTADVYSAPQRSASGGLSLEGDLTTFAAQFGYKTRDDVLVYGTLGLVDLDGADSGISVGGGLLYQLKGNLIANYNTAIKVSYHRFSTDTFIGDFTGSDLGFDAVFSPVEQNLFRGGEVFGFVGLHRLSADFSVFGSDSDFEIALGAGVISPFADGELFGAIEIIDDIFLGGGFRVELGEAR